MPFVSASHGLLGRICERNAILDRCLGCGGKGRVHGKGDSMKSDKTMATAKRTLERKVKAGRELRAEDRTVCN